MRRRALAAMLAIVVLIGACGVADLRDRLGERADAGVFHPNNETPGPTATPFPCRSRMRPGGDGAAYMPGDGGVRGCVIDTAGRAVSEASLVVESQPPGVALPNIGIGTDGSGRYSDGSLRAPGAYVLAVYADGYEVARERVEIREGRTAVLDFVLEPLSPAKATASAVAEARATPVLPPTPYPFPCASDTSGLGGEGGNVAHNENIAVGYWVAGCVRDPEGRGIAGASVTAVPLRADLPARRYAVRTGADGRYYGHNVTGIGWWEITARAPGYARRTRRVYVRNPPTTVVDFTLRRER